MEYISFRFRHPTEAMHYPDLLCQGTCEWVHQTITHRYALVSDRSAPGTAEAGWLLSVDVVLRYLSRSLEPPIDFRPVGSFSVLLAAFPIDYCPSSRCVSHYGTL